MNDALPALAWLITFVLVLLKITGKLAISWLIVFAPVIFLYGLGLLALLVVLLVAGLAFLVEHNKKGSDD